MAVPFWTAPGATLYLGDVRACLKALPARSVHAVITSPPYWALRDYGTETWEGGSAECDHINEVALAELKRQKKSMRVVGERCDGSVRTCDHHEERGKLTQYHDYCRKCGAKRTDKQIGAEPSPDCGTSGQAQCGGCFVCSLVSVFREVYRVLRDDGTLWLNLGDTYAGHSGAAFAENADGGVGRRSYGLARKTGGFLQGSLVGVPWRVALALQTDGWLLRAAMPWIKRNAMPDSALDRPSKATEDVFLFAKSSGYYFDMESVKVAGSGKKGGAVFGKEGADQHRQYDRPEYKKRAWRSGDLWLSEDGVEGFDVPAANFSGAHYATFPVRLITPMILAGTSSHGVCAGCKIPYTPIVVKEELEKVDNDGYDRDRSFQSSRNGLNSRLHDNVGGMLSQIVGWHKPCGCSTNVVVPAVVLDPFVGSGTTVATALSLGREGIGIDLSEEYLREHAIRRIEAAMRGEKMSKPTVAVLPDTPPPPKRLRG